MRSVIARTFFSRDAELNVPLSYGWCIVERGSICVISSHWVPVKPTVAFAVPRRAAPPLAFSPCTVATANHVKGAVVIRGHPGYIPGFPSMPFFCLVFYSSKVLPQWNARIGAGCCRFSPCPRSFSTSANGASVTRGKFMPPRGRGWAGGCTR